MSKEYRSVIRKTRALRMYTRFVWYAWTEPQKVDEIVVKVFHTKKRARRSFALLEDVV